MVEIVWKEPPPAVGSAETAEILAALKANPGKWAQVKKGMKSSTGYTTWKKLGCEAVARRDDARHPLGRLRPLAGGEDSTIDPGARSAADTNVSKPPRTGSDPACPSHTARPHTRPGSQQVPRKPARSR